MAKSLPLIILLVLIASTSWLCWLSLGDVLASFFVAATFTLAIVPGLLWNTGQRRWPS